MKEKTKREDKKKNIKAIIVIIVIYVIVGGGLPVLFKYLIFESKAFSNLSNNEWAGFLGSYVGGILGGLGTLISVLITVKDSRAMQIENKKDTDQKILDDKEEREKERKEEKILEEQRVRRKFSDDIAVYIGRYITDISKYFYASRWAESIDARFINVNEELEKVETELLMLDEKMSSIESNSDDYIEMEKKRDLLLDKERITRRKYNEQLKKKEKNSIEGNRTIAVECYFILQAKLSNIAEANALLNQLEILHNLMFYHLHEIETDWLEKNTDELKTAYSEFVCNYVDKFVVSDVA